MGVSSKCCVNIYSRKAFFFFFREEFNLSYQILYSVYNFENMVKFFFADKTKKLMNIDFFIKKCIHKCTFHINKQKRMIKIIKIYESHLVQV